MPLLPNLFRTKDRNALFEKFAQSAVSEAAKVAVSLGVGLVIPLPAIGELAGTISKEFVQTVLARASEVERKLDALIAEPFKTGLRLLLEAARHEVGTSEEAGSRDALLDAAHLSFVRAHSLVANSREDSVFVRTLDCLALAARSGRGTLAKKAMADVQTDMNLLYEQMQILNKAAAQWEDDVKAINRFFGRGDWGGKPIGYDVQLIWVKKQEKDAERIVARASKARARFTVLESVAALAKASIARL